MTTLFEETVEVLVGGGCPRGGGVAVPPPVESGHRQTHKTSTTQATMPKAMQMTWQFGYMGKNLP
jgi:hypothetical protein